MPQEPLEILVSKNGIIGDLIAGIAKKLNLDEQTARNVRVLEVHSGRIHKELIEDFNVVGVNEFTNLYAETIPDEELNASEDDRFIYCYHFDKDANKPHGVPFKFMLKPGEPLKETKERISKRTGIKGKLLQQIKFALVTRAPYGKPRYIGDDDIIVDLIQDGEEMLGLDHVNKARNFWNRAEGMFIR
jgi:ubiquitin carboxyl-terminal hydrolase 7